jgi:hypothetical protein
LFVRSERRLRGDDRANSWAPGWRAAADEYAVHVEAKFFLAGMALLAVAGHPLFYEKTLLDPACVYTVLRYLLCAHTPHDCLGDVG